MSEWYRVVHTESNTFSIKSSHLDVPFYSWVSINQLWPLVSFPFFLAFCEGVTLSPLPPQAPVTACIELDYGSHVTASRHL